MKKAPIARIPITLRVDKEIPLLENKNLSSLLRKKLTDSLKAYLSLQGIDGSPSVAVRSTGENDRILQVVVQGVSQPYSPETMRRAWQARAPRHLRSLPDQETIAYRFPDRWLKEYLLGLDHADQMSSDQAVAFLSELAFAAIMEKPSALIGQHQVLQYVGNMDGSGPVDLDVTASVLAFLLDHGVSIADNRTILDFIRQGQLLERSSEDTSELLLARLRRPSIEIIVSPEEFKNLAGGVETHGVISVYSDEVSKESRDLMNTMEEGLFWELGFYLPDLVWKTDPDTPPGQIAFRTNDQTTEGMPLLAPNELLVNEMPERLKLINVPAAAMAVNPASGRPCSAVETTYEALIEKAGLTIWGPLGYLILLTAGEIKRRAPRLFTVEDTAFHLAQIRQYFPVLTDKIMQRFSTESLTRVLRALLAERISIRDLRSILERLLQYDTIPVDAGKFIVFDERLPITPLSAVLHPDAWESHYEFLRSGFKRQITSSLFQGRSSIPVYLLDPNLEQWLLTENSAGKQKLKELDDKRHAVRRAIWAEINPSAGVNPIVLTTTESRKSLREVIGREMPHVLIIAYSELTPDVSLQPIARISLPEELGVDR
jgi:hypothetical protein